MKLIIGEKIPSRKRTNVFQIEANAMSGDGDHYELQRFHGDETSVVEKLKILNAVFDLSWNARTDPDEIDTAIESCAEELGLDLEECTEWYYDFIGRDVVNDSCRAMLYAIDIFWFDEHGDKYKVSTDNIKA